jgi:hypothetical protein
MLDIQGQLLRTVAVNAGVPAVRELAQQPSVQAVYRLIVYHHDAKTCDVVATLTQGVLVGIQWSVLFVGLSKQPFHHTFSFARYQAFASGLQSLGFDKLYDQPNMPSHGCDLWMLERASASFIKSIVVAPDSATQQHAALCQYIREYWASALRAVQKD